MKCFKITSKRRYTFAGTKYISIQLRNESSITRYDHANNFIRLQINQNDPEKLFFKCLDETCGFHTNQIWSPVYNLTISNEYDFTDVSVQLNVFEVNCTFYNETELAWSKSGVVSGDQALDFSLFFFFENYPDWDRFLSPTLSGFEIWNDATLKIQNDLDVI